MMPLAQPIGLDLSGDPDLSYVEKGSTAWKELRTKSLGFDEVRIVDPELTQFGVDWLSGDRMFVHQTCCTPVPVEAIAGSFGVWDLVSYLKNRAMPVADQGEQAEGSLSRSKDSYIVIPMSYKEAIGDIAVAQSSSAVNLQRNKSQKVAWTCGLTRELAFFNIINTVGNWAGKVTGGAATHADFDAYSTTAAERVMRKWSDLANATPLKDLGICATGMLERTRMHPNTLILGAEVLDYLLNTDDVVERNWAGQTSGQARGTVGNIVEYMTAHGAMDFRVEVMREIQIDDANTDQTKFINKRGAWLGYVERSPSMEMPTAIANFYWTQFGGAETTIDTYRDVGLMRSFVRGVYANQFKAVTSACGIHFTDVV